jgi:hypothetical protein
MLTATGACNYIVPLVCRDYNSEIARFSGLGFLANACALALPNRTSRFTIWYRLVVIVIPVFAAVAEGVSRNATLRAIAAVACAHEQLPPKK